MPVFYCEDIEENEFALPDDESRHCIRVLRQQQGDIITVVNGKGLEKQARIIVGKPSKVVCETVSESTSAKSKDFRVHVAISPTKNMDRIEWFVEKSCELDIDEISFIYTEHSERKVLKTERLHKKAISALKQSGGRFKTIINEPLKLKDFLNQEFKEEQKLFAFVDSENPDTLKNKALPKRNYLILIGPEGDFSLNEYHLLVDNNFEAVSLGRKVLRTETAGIIACHSVNFLNDF